MHEPVRLRCFCNKCVMTTRLTFARLPLVFPSCGTYHADDPMFEYTVADFALRGNRVVGNWDGFEANVAKLVHGVLLCMKA